MLLLTCPFCGPSPETEFRCGGEAHIARPPDPGALDDQAWCEYLFYRSNPKGLHAERWVHVYGCARWFNVLRHTVNDTVVATYRIGEARPDVPPTPGTQS
jgi:sarcosine oxidase subunit delta